MSSIAIAIDDDDDKGARWNVPHWRFSGDMHSCWWREQMDLSSGVGFYGCTRGSGETVDT